MRWLVAYVLLSVTTVLLATAWGGKGIGIAGLVAVLICQPWLGLTWVAYAQGWITTDSLSATWIAVFCGLNSVLWLWWLKRSRRKLE